MSSESIHINNIIFKHNRIANIQVVFVDIEKYSKRRTSKQIGIIDLFTKLLNDSLLETSQHFVIDLQNNNINLKKDTIFLPTGDGAAIVFSFEDLYDIHLFFALKLLEKIFLENEKNACDKFEKNKWCNCHLNFSVRIGISKDEGIIYKDINENFNVAGKVINYAARVMSLADKEQIIFTKEGYDKFENLSNVPDIESKFKAFDGVEIKHGEKITIYQYIGDNENYVNRNTPSSLIPKSKPSVKIITKKDNLPIFIATDIEGCITPDNRDEIDLQKFEKLQYYCQFVKANPEYPQITFFTGRSQGYVELLMQSLGMINNIPFDLPSVIENGAALYFPNSRKIVPLTSPEQLRKINEARSLLNNEFYQNRFEPKGYMITVNNNTGQKIEDLRKEIDSCLTKEGYDDFLETHHSASAVDVTAKGINKLTGVKEILSHFLQIKGGNYDLQNIVAIGDHQADLDVLKAVGRGYCPYLAPLEVKDLVSKNFGANNIIKAGYADLVLQVIETECEVEFS